MRQPNSNLSEANAYMRDSAVTMVKQREANNIKLIQAH
jgi:hypothetical protein